MTNSIVVNHLHKKIKDKVILKDIDFTIAKGECVALIGENGAGKTTLMRCLLGDLTQEKGTITIEGLKATDTRLTAIVSVLVQENVLPTKLTAADLIQFYQVMYPQGLSSADIDALLAFTPAQKRQTTDKLSGGQRRLLAFVLSLISRPQVLFLDEPTSSMDTSTRMRFWEIVQQLKTTGVTIFYTSHYIEEVEHTAQRILVLHQGELIRDTTPYAMKAEKVEKHVTLPLRYATLLQAQPLAYQIDIQADSMSFITSDIDALWQVLAQNGCQLSDIEIKNKTLLDSLFDTTRNRGVDNEEV